MKYWKVILVGCICFLVGSFVFSKYLSHKLYQYIDDGDFSIQYTYNDGDESGIETIDNTGKLTISDTTGIEPLIHEYDFPVEDVQEFLRYAVKKKFFKLGENLNKTRNIHDGGDAFFTFTFGDKHYKIGGVNPSLKSFRYSLIYSKYYEMFNTHREYSSLLNRGASVNMNSNVSTEIRFKRIFSREEVPSFYFKFKLLEIPKDLKTVKLKFLSEDTIEFISPSEYRFDVTELNIRQEIKVKFEPNESYHYGPIFCYLTFYDHEGNLIEETYTDIRYIITDDRVNLWVNDWHRDFILSIPEYIRLDENNKNEMILYIRRAEFLDQNYGTHSYAMLLDKTYDTYEDMVVKYDFSFYKNIRGEFYNDESVDLFIRIKDSAASYYKIDTRSTGNLFFSGTDDVIPLESGEVIIDFKSYLLSSEESHGKGYLEFKLTTYDENMVPLITKSIFTKYDKDQHLIIEDELDFEQTQKNYLHLLEGLSY